MNAREWLEKNIGKRVRVKIEHMGSKNAPTIVDKNLNRSFSVVLTTLEIFRLGWQIYLIDTVWVFGCENLGIANGNTATIDHEDAMDGKIFHFEFTLLE